MRFSKSQLLSGPLSDQTNIQPGHRCSRSAAVRGAELVQPWGGAVQQRVGQSAVRGADMQKSEALAAVTKK